MVIAAIAIVLLVVSLLLSAQPASQAEAVKSGGVAGFPDGNRDSQKQDGRSDAGVQTVADAVMPTEPDWAGNVSDSESSEFDLVTREDGTSSETDEQNDSRERQNDGGAKEGSMPIEDLIAGGPADVGSGNGVVENPASPTRVLNIGDGFVSLSAGPANPLRVGAEIESVVYVIDKSSSMAGERFQKVSQALHDAIDALNDDQEFAVILFDSQPMPIGNGKLVSATNQTKTKITSELERIVAAGGTFPVEAMTTAIYLRPDAIILLSDGEFSDSDASGIIEANQAAGDKTSISCIGLQRHIHTLKRIAEKNRGVYVSIR